MSIRSLLFLFDDHHWTYVDHNRESIKKDIVDICNYAECIFDDDGSMMIFDIGREPPESFIDIVCDYMMFTDDSGNHPYPTMIDRQRK